MFLVEKHLRRQLKEANQALYQEQHKKKSLEFLHHLCYQLLSVQMVGLPRLHRNGRPLWGDPANLLLLVLYVIF